MRRSEALASLSRDHHHGLVVAQRLRRATGESAADARAAFLDFWHHDGNLHFRVEEEVLLPRVAARVAPTDDAVVRVLTEHVEIRRRADALERSGPAVDAQHELGAMLHDHIRHEERVLFPRIEAALSDEELSDLAVAVEAAHDAG